MRRALLPVLLAASLIGCGREEKPPADTPRIALVEPIDETRIDFEQWDAKEWTVSEGKWEVQEVADAPSGKKVLVQTSTDMTFPVIVWNGAEFADLEVSVKFRPVSGSEDASGGIVLRFADGRYYVCRANALEDNFRLYTYERGTRTQIAGVTRKAPSKGAWHSLSMIAIGDRIQCALDGDLLISHQDSRFAKGKMGLWTKADSVTQFADLVIRARRVPIGTFDGVDFTDVPSGLREEFLRRVNLEECPCGSKRTLARCRKAGCARALERGNEILETIEQQR